MLRETEAEFAAQAEAEDLGDGQVRAFAGEGEFYGCLQAFEEGFLPGFATDPFAGMTAFTAEYQGFAAAPPEPTNAFVAHDFFAMEAVVNAALQVTLTQKRTISKDYRRSGVGLDFEPRDANGDVDGFGDELDFAEPQGATGRELGRNNRLPVNKGPIGGAAIADEQSLCGDVDLAMKCGNSVVFDLKIAFRPAPQPVGSQPELEHALFKSLGFNH